MLWGLRTVANSCANVCYVVGECCEIYVQLQTHVQMYAMWWVSAVGFTYSCKLMCKFMLCGE